MANSQGWALQRMMQRIDPHKPKSSSFPQRVHCYPLARGVGLILCGKVHFYIMYDIYTYFLLCLLQQDGGTCEQLLRESQFAHHMIYFPESASVAHPKDQTSQSVCGWCWLLVINM